MNTCKILIEVMENVETANYMNVAKDGLLVDWNLLREKKIGSRKVFFYRLNVVFIMLMKKMKATAFC